MNDAVSLPRLALLGNPNCGKTALFNLLTGSRQKVANYAGVTVERKEGLFRTPGGRSVRVLDLPGAYSLDATSPDEAITRDVCRGALPGEPVPDPVVSLWKDGLAQRIEVGPLERAQVDELAEKAWKSLDMTAKELGMATG